MRKKNMFGIALKEEWKLNRRTFLLFTGVILAVNIVIGFISAISGFTPETFFEGSSFGLPNITLILLIYFELLALGLVPLLFAVNLNKQVFIDDSSFLYKMLPINGFELLGAKILVGILEFIAILIAVSLSVLLICTELYFFSKDGTSWINLFYQCKDGIKDMFGDNAFKKIGIVIIRMGSPFLFFANLIITFSAIKKSFNIKINNTLLIFIAYIVFFIIIQYIWQIPNNIVGCLVPIGLAILTFIGNCILYEKKVGV